ncbi:Cytochrome C oxidase subunit II [Caenorhabditis elegans]|uniref:Cytochrome C oxidase subunit II n=1 Tax=Caenorhabditis elegans TaxID=6239 RepID=O62344_CAEEL|nr:Cytochrome C oxidase subunit II [Caenorhabditis elegans]CAB04648.1 Cytochrome C oxidase subunit II [Caenorhabditis elegans]|eukprot:NP_510640.1 Uncharacterized protein CELE_R11.4 [Caenorhabditis elegans]
MNKIIPLVQSSKTQKAEKVAVEMPAAQSIQEQYASAHTSTGKEIAIFVGILVIAILCFFGAMKLC